MEKSIYLPLLFVIFAAIITLGYVFVLFRKVSRIPINNQKVEDIHNHIHEGSMTFLIREYKLIIPFIFGIGIVLTLLGFIPSLEGAEGIGWKAAICFVIGACFSAAAGWIGMFIATTANARTAVKAHDEGMSGALRVAFSGGAVLGLYQQGIILVHAEERSFKGVASLGADHPSSSVEQAAAVVTEASISPHTRGEVGAPFRAGHVQQAAGDLPC